MQEQFINCAKKNRIPLTCTLEITTRCNFNCPHCYMKGYNLVDIDLKKAEKILVEVRKKGGLYLTLTGGEAFLYKKFKELYIFAYNLGFKITIFTNLYLLTEDLINLLSIYKPMKVETTIYGTSNENYYGCNPVLRPYDTVVNNLIKLKKKCINVGIKMVLTNYNYSMFEKISQLSKNLEIDFRFDYNLWPSLNGDDSIIEFQCSSDKIINLLLSRDGELIHNWKRDYKNKRREKCFNCGGGRYSFYINSNFILKPCLYGDYCKFDLNKLSFSEAWEQMGVFLNTNTENYNSKCYNCKYVNLCDACPAYIYAFTKKLCLHENENLNCCDIAHKKAVCVFNNINVLPYVSVELVKKILFKTKQLRTKIYGSSMYPFFKEGDDILIKKREITDLKVGDVVLYNNNNILIVHRILSIGNDSIITKGDNSDEKAIICNKDVLGIVCKDEL